jgi:hypothetical protein
VRCGVGPGRVRHEVEEGLGRLSIAEGWQGKMGPARLRQAGLAADTHCGAGSGRGRHEAAEGLG